MSTSPFEGRAAAYSEYRAAYPREATNRVIERAGLTGAEAVADLGSGTGLLSERLLDQVRRLYAVEPAEDMRRAAESALGGHASFQSVAGTAENTSLPDSSVDAITCGNAFHYFDAVRTRSEVGRLLRAGGRVVLLFNEWPVEPAGFTRDYLEFLRSVTPPALRSAHSDSEFEQRLALFLDGRTAVRDEGEQTEELSWERLAGRFASTSIAPDAGAPDHDAVYSQLRRLFDAHERDSTVPLALRWVCVSVTWS